MLQGRTVNPLLGGTAQKVPSWEGIKGWVPTAMTIRNRRNIIPYNPKLKDLARKLRKNMTLAEVLLWNALKHRQMLGYDFDRQRPLDAYIVDFYCKDLTLAVEIDGGSHDFPEVHTRDKSRQQRLERLGVRFLRFTNEQVQRDLEAVLQTIEAWIGTHGG
jgi:very-short-patch-repair endonuclease